MSSIVNIIGAPGSGVELVSQEVAKVLKAELFAKPQGQNEYLPKIANGDPVHFAYQARELHLAVHQENTAKQSLDNVVVIEGGVLQTLGVSIALNRMGKIDESELEALERIATNSSRLSPKETFVFKLSMYAEPVRDRVEYQDKAFELVYNKKELNAISKGLTVVSQGKAIFIDANQPLKYVVADIKRIWSSRQWDLGKVHQDNEEMHFGVKCSLM